MCIQNTFNKSIFVLPHPNGIKISRIVSHLMENVFFGTGWIVFVLNSIESISDDIQLIFSDASEMSDFLSLQTINKKTDNLEVTT